MSPTPQLQKLRSVMKRFLKPQPKKLWSVRVSSECRKIKPSIMKEDASVIECVIIETLTSIAEIDEHRVKCRHCRCWSTVETFHIHDCSRSKSDVEFFHVP